MLIEEIIGDRFKWVRPDKATMKADYDEYKVKEEEKWIGRAYSMGFRFPIFDTLEQYEQEVQNSPVVKVDDTLWRRVENLSANDSLKSVEKMVSTYTVPRNVERIVDGIRNGDRLPYPVILKGSDGYHIMSGNTRLNVARILGASPEAIVIDVS